MTCLQWLQTIANVASIATAIIAAWAGSWYLYQRRQKRLRLERHLKAQKDNSKGGDHGQRSIIDLMAALGMTEAEVMDSAYQSTCIRLVAGRSPSGEILRLEYSGDDSN